MSIFDISQKDRQNIANIFSLENIFNKLKKSEFLPTGEFDKLEEQLENVQRNISNVFTPDIKTNYEQYVEKDFISADELEEQQKKLAVGEGEQKKKLQEDIQKLLSETYAPPEQFKGPGGKIEPYQGYFLPELISKPPGGAPGFKVGRGNVTDARGSFRQIMELPGSNDLTNQIMRLQSLQDQAKQFKRQETKDRESAISSSAEFAKKIEELRKSQLGTGISPEERKREQRRSTFGAGLNPLLTEKEESELQKRTAKDVILDQAKRGLEAVGGALPKDVSTEKDAKIISPIGEQKTFEQLKNLGASPGDRDLINKQLGIGDEQASEAGDELLNNSMSELALFGEVPEKLTPEQRIEKINAYKKEFYEATGLDPSGKPDKSDALIAFGLALMQNKAGKKLNLGKVFKAIGKAGEKSLPLIRQAKKEAKAESLAASKFALDKLEKGENAIEAIKQANRSFARELYLKNLEIEQKAIEEAKKRIEEGSKTDVGTKADFTIKAGGQDIKYSKIFDNKARKMVYLAGENLAKDLALNHNLMINARESLGYLKILSRTMMGLEEEREIEKAEGIHNAEAWGGRAVKLLFDRGLTGLKAMGIGNQQEFFKDVNKLVVEGKLPKKFKGLSAESSYDVIADAFLLRYKRFITKETGNGISNVDFQVAETNIGKPKLFEDPGVTFAKVEEMEQNFIDSQKAIEAEIVMMYDPTNYITYETPYEGVNREYLKVKNYFDNNLTYKIPTQFESDSGDAQNVIDVSS